MCVQFAACLGLRVVYYLVVEMLEMNGERLDGIHEQSTLAQLDELTTNNRRLEDQQVALAREIESLRRHVQRNERVLARYANEHGEKIDALKDFEQRMSPISEMLREAAEEVQSDTLFAKGTRLLFAPANFVFAVISNPFGLLFPS